MESKTFSLGSKANICAVGGDLSRNQNQVPYDTEHFFETANDNLIEIKNIFDSKQLWERVSSFFHIKVHPHD